MFAIVLMQRFLKFRYVLLTRLFGITSRSGPVISVNQNFLTLPFLTNRFIIAILLLTYVAYLEKEYKLVRARLLLVNSPVSSDVIDSACNKYHSSSNILGHYAHCWIFWREFFVARKKRLGAQGSGLQARKIASPNLKWS